MADQSCIYLSEMSDAFAHCLQLAFYPDDRIAFFENEIMRLNDVACFLVANDCEVSDVVLDTLAMAKASMLKSNGHFKDG